MGTEKNWVNYATFLGNNGAASAVRHPAPQSDILARDVSRALRIVAEVFGRTSGVRLGLQSAPTVAGPWVQFVEDVGNGGEGPTGEGTGSSVILIDPRTNPYLTQPARLLRWAIQVDASLADWELTFQLRYDDACECAPGVVVAPTPRDLALANSGALAANPMLLRQRLMGLGGTADGGVSRPFPALDLQPWTSLRGSFLTAEYPIIFPADGPFDTADLCTMLVNVDSLYASGASLVLETSHTLDGDRLGEWVELDAPPTGMNGTYYLSKRPPFEMPTSSSQVQLLRRYLRWRVVSTAADWALCTRVQLTRCA